MVQTGAIATPTIISQQHAHFITMLYNYGNSLRCPMMSDEINLSYELNYLSFILLHVYNFRFQILLGHSQNSSLFIFTGAKPILGLNCMITYIKTFFIYGIIQIGLKTGLAHVFILVYSVNIIQEASSKINFFMICCRNAEISMWKGCWNAYVVMSDLVLIIVIVF